MASTADMRPGPFGLRQNIPILSSSSSSAKSMPSPTPPRDPMDTTSGPSMGPPVLSSAAMERNDSNHHTNGESLSGNTSNSDMSVPTGAAAAAQQPKLVQTAFVHKLYNMLDDPRLAHLISWSLAEDSFVMSPSNEFAKVLAQYFKHTNISSFVRQLNMYGFHKVSDVFHNGSTDQGPLWEFKHGGGSFKKGHIAGLRDIKRRASKNTLMNRDPFPTLPKPIQGPPVGAPVEPVPDPTEARLLGLESAFYDMQSRLQRFEDHCAYLNNKNMMLVESLIRVHRRNTDLTSYIIDMVPDPENRIHRDAQAMRSDIQRDLDILRTSDEPHEPVSARQTYFINIDSSNGAPLSPRQTPHDYLSDSHRPSAAGLPTRPPFKAPVPPHLGPSPRRYGSIGTGNYSPSSARTPTAQQPPPPPPPAHLHPPGATLGAGLNASPPYNLYRRHTSADIRTHGWTQPPPPPSQQPQGPSQSQLQSQLQSQSHSQSHPHSHHHSPYASGHNSTQWPSSPHRTPLGAPEGDQHLRSVLEQYQIPRGPGLHSQQQQQQQQQHSRHASPRLISDNTPPALNPDGSWSLPGPRFPPASRLGGIDTPGPPTRRSSYASNVHFLLNSAEAPGEGEGERDGDEDVRKRKRVG